MSVYVKVGADTTYASEMDEFVRDFERAVNLAVGALEIEASTNPILEHLLAVLDKWSSAP